MTKIARLFTVDVDVYERARKRGVNLSEAAEHGLRSVTNMQNIKVNEKTLSPKMKEALNMMTEGEKALAVDCLDRNPNSARGWKKRIKNTTGVDVTIEEIVKVFGKGK